MKLNFRKLVSADGERKDFKDLLKQLTSKDIDWPNLAILLDDPDFVHVLAEDIDERKIIGYGSFPIYRSLVKGTTAVLEDIVVHEDYRDQGIGGEIYDQLEEIVVERGAQVATLTSNPTREKARAMYESRGYELRDTGFFEKHLTG